MAYTAVREWLIQPFAHTAAAGGRGGREPAGLRIPELSKRFPSGHSGHSSPKHSSGPTQVGIGARDPRNSALPNTNSRGAFTQIKT